MTEFINRFKIPTILGLGIIFLGIVIGVYLVLREQVFLSQAAPNLTPRNVTLTNITDDSVVISWQTNSPAASFITFGQGSPGEQTVLDDRDNNPAGAGPKPHLTHYVTLKNLLPKTSYQFKIITGKITSEIEKFETGAPLTNQTVFPPVIGSVLDDTSPLADGIVYLSIPEATTQSALIKGGGNFLIPLSQISKVTEGTIAKLTIRSNKEETQVLFRLKIDSKPLPPIKLGQDMDLTTEEPISQPNPVITDLNKYDLNSDGKINSTDYAMLSACFNKKPSTILPGGRSCTRADINTDDKIDQKDLGLISQKLKNQ